MPKRRLSSAPALVRGMSEPLPDLQANNSLKRSRTIGEDEQDFKGDFSGLREFHDVDHRLLNHDHSHHERPPHSFRRSRRSAASVSSGHNSAPLLESLVAHISLTEDPESLPYLNLDPLEDDQYSIINDSDGESEKSRDAPTSDASSSDCPSPYSVCSLKSLLDEECYVPVQMKLTDFELHHVPKETTQFENSTSFGSSPGILTTEKFAQGIEFTFAFV